MASFTPIAAILALTIAGTVGQAYSQEAEPDARYLRAALEVAAWLDHVALSTDDGEAWPAQIEGQVHTGLDLYAGVPGVVLFFLEAHHQTGREAFLKHARRGADWLLVELERADSVPAGLYTGLAGLGFTFSEVWRATGERSYRLAAERCVEKLGERSEPDEHGVRWNNSTDVISGSAGVGLFLLYAERELGGNRARELARKAGDHLLDRAIPEHGGLKWNMTPEYERRMPNFSHGTAGVGHFLVALYERTADERYLAAARAGARYLHAVAKPIEGVADATLIFHSEPGREDLFYLGWCHGPAGTTRFLRTLARATDTDGWGEDADRLVRALHASGVPEETPGFWNNVGVCCGSAGIADLLIGLYRIDGGEEHRALAAVLLQDLLERSRMDGGGRRWTHAEHRVRPDLLTTQTGAMQGAAGIGLVLLRAHALQTGRTSTIVFPDDPWTSFEPFHEER